MFATLHAQVSEALGLSLPARDALQGSLLPLLGSDLTPEAATLLAWRLAGNLQTLRAGGLVPVWEGQRGLEWAPVEFVSARPVSRRKGLAWTYKARVLAGTPAGLLATTTWSRRAIEFLTPTLGFTRAKRDGTASRYPFADPTQVVRLQALALLDPDWSRDGPGFFQAKAPPSLVDHNHRVLDVRCRREPCPRGHFHPCHACAAGFGDNQNTCEFATHKSQWSLQECATCRQMAAFDPDWGELECVACHRRKAARPKT